MKKLLVILSLFALLVGLFGCRAEPAPSETAVETASPDWNRWQVALVSDYGSPLNGGFKQDVFEAAQAWCREKGVAFSVYEPKEDSTAERVEMIRQAVREGANVLLLPEYVFASAIVETVEQYSDVYYIAPCVTAYDLKSAVDPFSEAEYVCPANLYCVNYREEIAGYLAGWAAVAGGSDRLGIPCGYGLNAQLRLCYGFIQGADAAAAALGRSAEVELRYYALRARSYCVDEEALRAGLEAWYAAGTEFFFPIGDSLFLDCAAQELAADGKLFAVADALYRPGGDKPFSEAAAFCVRMDYGVAVRRVLTELIENDNWAACGGTIAQLGIISEDPAQNGILLAEPLEVGKGFTEADYAALIGALYRGERKVSDAVDHVPEVGITVIEDNVYH